VQTIVLGNKGNLNHLGERTPMYFQFTE